MEKKGIKISSTTVNEWIREEKSKKEEMKAKKSQDEKELEEVPYEYSNEEDSIIVENINKPISEIIGIFKKKGFNRSFGSLRYRKFVVIMSKKMVLAHPELIGESQINGVTQIKIKSIEEQAKKHAEFLAFWTYFVAYHVYKHGYKHGKNNK